MMTEDQVFDVSVEVGSEHEDGNGNLKQNATIDEHQVLVDVPVEVGSQIVGFQIDDDDGKIERTAMMTEDQVFDVSVEVGSEHEDDNGNLKQNATIDEHQVLVDVPVEVGSQIDDDDGMIERTVMTEHEVVELSVDVGSQLDDDDGKIERTTKIEEQVVDVSIDVGSKLFNDDRKLKRTAVIGTGVLSLAWAMAQLGWIAGPMMVIIFALVTFLSSALLADCYQPGDPDSGKTSFSYMDAVRANLGGFKVMICEAIEYIYLFGVAVGYIIAASGSLTAIGRSNCFHSKGDSSPCTVSGTPFIIGFGVVQVFLSQIPDFDQISWLPSLAAILSFTYTTLGLGLGIAQVAENRKPKGSLTGVINMSNVTDTVKIWGCFQALGAIAFAYSYSIILVEIQDTRKSDTRKSPPPSKNKSIKRATFVSVAVTTILYMSCGCLGYAAFGDLSPGNLLTGFAYYNPYWLPDIANAVIVVHLIIAYQVNSQPLFALVEKMMTSHFPDTAKEITVPIPGGCKLKLDLYRLVWRTVFVIITTVISIFMPFLSVVVGILGALRFWPLTVYFPVEIYIAQKRIARWSSRWMCLQILSGSCLLISIAAGVGSVAGFVSLLKVYKPF